MKKIVIVLFSLTLLTATKPDGPSPWTSDTPLSTVLLYLGESPPSHFLPMEKRTEENITIGQAIFEKGYVPRSDGKKVKPQSKFFTCTDCHNTVIEDSDLRVSDPEKRFPYIWEQGIPMLQGTTVKGVVNKASWYNDDYEKKYGDLVKPARNDLKEAIQLCSRECSQGRELTATEMEGMLAYFRSLEYSLEDLKLSEEDLERLRTEAQNPDTHTDLVTWLKGLYLQKSPATFGDIPEDPVKGYGHERSYERGEQIYKLSCLHCHAPGRILKWPYVFKYDKHTFGFLAKYFPRDHHYSPYNALRKGSYTSKKKKLYMPNFTLEKMSDQQIEDLREYIMTFLEKEGGKNK